MRFLTLSAAWLFLSATRTVFATEDYVPRPLDETVRELGLEGYVEELPELEKRTFNRCEIACGILDKVLRDETQKPGSVSYKANQESYWAQQQSSISPSCFIAATKRHHVAIAITLSRVTQCPFAVRSGGHSDVPGASNVEGGITIDLREFSGVNVSDDKATVAVGSGAKWGEVYSELEKHDLTVIGGRATDVGVGGLLLGGGMSFFSGRGGFACDNVKNYKVLMADGLILDVNYKSYPDLYWALRGGGNNFGVVLEFDLEAIPQGKMWGGLRAYTLDAQPAITKGLASFNEHAAGDPDLAVISSFMYIKGAYMTTFITDYAKPEPYPAILNDHFGGLDNHSAILDTTRIAGHAELAAEIGAGTPNGMRNQFTTATYKNSAGIQNTMIEIFKEEVDNVMNKVVDAAGLKPVIAFQPIPTTISSHFSKNGGNALGIKPEDGPLILVQFNWGWTKQEDDEAVMGAIDNILTRSNTEAEELGLCNDYIYQNYAAPNQKPIQSYGAENLGKLHNVQCKYDPLRVFERLQPGGFKLHD